MTAQLGARFDRELIYTAIGDTLISVNPYKYLPITTDDHISLYQNVCACCCFFFKKKLCAFFKFLKKFPTGNRADAAAHFQHCRGSVPQALR